MRYFFSVGEPSGDIHGANLMKAIAAHDSQASFAGFGGDRMRQAGADLLYPLANHPVMGLSRVLAALPHFIALAKEAERRFDRERPDAVVLIDYPGFNWHIAKRAKERSIPVFYFVPPQIWSWATWRVEKMRRFVDVVLCSLPFEEAWYHERGVAGAKYIGHPFFDDLADRRLDGEFLAKERVRSGRPVALLPGSRTMEVKWNTRVLIDAAERLAREVPGTRFLIGAFKDAHVPMIRRHLHGRTLPVEIHVGKTPEIMHLAKAAIAVSGSVSLELMHFGVPTAIVYRIDPIIYGVLRPLLLKTPYITLVNLMAGQKVYPEFVTCGNPSQEIAKQVGRWLTDEREREHVTRRLAALKRFYGSPGATAAAAEVIAKTLHLPKAPALEPVRLAG